jgi:hypothetical protein
MPFKLSASADMVIMLYRPVQVGVSHDEFVWRRDPLHMNVAGDVHHRQLPC